MSPSARVCRSPLLDPRPQRRAGLGDRIGALAALLEEGDRFAAREQGDGEELAEYRLRHGGLRLFLRHGTPDVGILEEVFALRAYEPPPAVASLLDAARPGPKVIDCGAHVGMFGLQLLARYPEARLTSFEPDPANRAVLERCRAANAVEGQWDVLAACVAAADAEVLFQAEGLPSSRISAAGEGGGIRVPAVDVLPLLAGADLAKIDVEGGEWSLLTDPRLAHAPVPAIVLEHHPGPLCPFDDPAASALALLREAGYHAQPAHLRPDGVGMVWAWRA